MNGVTTDIEKLRKLYRRRDQEAKRVIDRLAGHLCEEETLADVVERGSGVEYLKVVAVLKELEKAGCGKFIVGRKGGQTRMRWAVDPTALRSVASGESDEFPAFEQEASAEAEISSDPQAEHELLTHVYKLRKDLTVSFDLPGDLSRSEAERLAKFIESLPFE